MANPHHVSASAACATLCTFALVGIVVSSAVPAYSVASNSAPRSRGDPTKCMTRFRATPNAFDRCVNEICFMFISEEPYITVPTNITQKLFSCTDHAKAFPGLKGITFDIFDHIKNTTKDSPAPLLPNAQCVWAGNDCLFNDLVAFLNETSVSHMFAITGMLLEVSHRMTKRLFPSTSFFDDKMVVIGKVEKKGPLDQLKRPFRNEAWILFGIMLIVFFAFGALVVWVFSPDSFSFINMALHFLGDYPERDTTEDESQRTGLGNGPGDSTSTVSDSENEANNPTPPQRIELNEGVARNREALYKSAVLLWRIALSAFLVILLLFYEVAVVNFLFIEQSNPQGVRVTKLGERQLREYAVLENSALEDVWSRTVDPYGEFDSSNFPWYRCPTEGDCFKQLLNKSDERVKYVVTFNALAQYKLKQLRQCSQLTVYSTERRLYTFGAGWLYGRKVNDTLRRDVDKMILDLRVTDKMRELVENTMGGKDGRCEAESGDIGAQIVILPLGLLVGPCLIGLMVVLCVSWKRRAAAADAFNESLEQEEFSQPTLAEDRRNAVSLSQIRQRQLISDVLRRRPL